MAKNDRAARYLFRTETERLISWASTTVGFDLGKKPRFTVSRNMVGIEDGTLTFGQRVDSNTIFARNSAYGPTREAGAYTGARQPLVSGCRRMLRRFDVPAAEIATIEVLEQFGQVAERLPDSTFRLATPTLLCRFAFARRVVQAVPIWSSSATMAWTKLQEIGFLELHWPDVSRTAIREALLLRELVKRGWPVPPVPEADLQLVEAGVIHSPAIADYMDVLPVIRVVYAPKDGKGMKPVRYFDRHGSAAVYPRTADIDRGQVVAARETPA